MGYSYLAVNGAALSAIVTILQRDLGNVPNGSNTWGDGFFYETGREQADGSITGTVWADTTSILRLFQQSCLFFLTLTSSSARAHYRKAIIVSVLLAV